MLDRRQVLIGTAAVGVAASLPAVAATRKGPTLVSRGVEVTVADSTVGSETRIQMWLHAFGGPHKHYVWTHHELADRDFSRLDEGVVSFRLTGDMALRSIGDQIQAQVMANYRETPHLFTLSVQDPDQPGRWVNLTNAFVETTDFTYPYDDASGPVSAALMVRGIVEPTQDGALACDRIMDDPYRDPAVA